MHLTLSGARLRLPTAVEFTSLTDLSLEWIKIEASSVHLLARLVSSARELPAFTKAAHEEALH
jgi:hypothetical protein